jgi:drug/metabolite transporter (DMT)-like permease
MTFYAIAFASLFWAIVNPPWNVLAQSPSSEAWGGLVVLALISVLIPHSLYFAGMQYVAASRAIISSTLEPVVAMVSAAVVLGELLKHVQIVGAVFVVGAILLLQFKKESEASILVQEAP